MTSHVRRVALGGFVFAATLIWGSTPSHAISCIGAGEVTSFEGGWPSTTCWRTTPAVVAGVREAQFG
jgi:hypothetical protein